MKTLGNAQLILVLVVLVAITTGLLSFVSTDIYFISVIDFIVILAVVVYRDRKKYDRQFILLLRRTQRGKSFITWLGTRFPRFWKHLGNFGVVLGFVFSLWMFATLALITYDNLTATDAIPTVAILLPSLSSETVILPGVFAPPFWFWIITIALLAIVHEGFHGILTARERIKIKSLGFGLLAVIPLAFVEPDEVQLQKKPFMAQQRIFAAGSLANFLLAALSLFLLIQVSTAAFSQTGVFFSSYPGEQIETSSITALAGIPISNPGMLKSELQKLDPNTTVSLQAEETYLARPNQLLEQLGESDPPEKIIVSQNYPAALAGVQGVITDINGETITNTIDLDRALEKSGPNSEIILTTTSGEQQQTYTLTTAAEPEPQFSSDATITFLGYLEHVMPANDIVAGTLYSFASLAGNAPPRDWRMIQVEIKQWEYYQETFPVLQDKASTKLSALQAELQTKPQGGFIGIAGIGVQNTIKPGLELFQGPLGFIQGLLTFMFLINFFVGAFNLMPIKALDGGRMWELLFMKISKKRYKHLINLTTAIGLFLILANFALLARVF